MSIEIENRQLMLVNTIFSIKDLIDSATNDQIDTVFRETVIDSKLENAIEAIVDCQIDAARFELQLVTNELMARPDINNMGGLSKDVICQSLGEVSENLRTIEATTALKIEMNDIKECIIECFKQCDIKVPPLKTLLRCILRCLRFIFTPLAFLGCLLRCLGLALAKEKLERFVDCFKEWRNRESLPALTTPVFTSNR